MNPAKQSISILYFFSNLSELFSKYDLFLNLIVLIFIFDLYANSNPLASGLFEITNIILTKEFFFF